MTRMQGTLLQKVGRKQNLEATGWSDLKMMELSVLKGSRTCQSGLILEADKNDICS
jgi:hypothetical protein